MVATAMTTPRAHDSHSAPPPMPVRLKKDATLRKEPRPRTLTNKLNSCATQIENLAPLVYGEKKRTRKNAQIDEQTESAPDQQVHDAAPPKPKKKKVRFQDPEISSVRCCHPSA